MFQEKTRYVFEAQKLKVFLSESGMKEIKAVSGDTCLELLYRNKGNAVRREEIATAGWPERQGDVTDEEIDQYILRLRRRIEENPSRPKLVVTLRGFGYRMP